MKRRKLLQLSAAFAGGVITVPSIALFARNRHRMGQIQRRAAEVMEGFSGAAYAGEQLPVLPKDDIRFVMPVALAYMRMVMQAEGTYIPGRPELNPYKVIVGYDSFDSFSDHPRRQVCTDRWCSDAAGAYQFLSSTWDSLKSQFSDWPSGDSFSPKSQDYAFLYNHGLTGAHSWLRKSISQNKTQLWVDRKSWERAIFCDSNQWASLPGENIGASTGQRTKDYDFLWESFTWELEGLLNQRRNIAFPIEGFSPDDLTSGYGWRIHPVHKERRFHAGNDYGAEAGTPIVAPEAGSIVLSEWSGEYGNAIAFVPDSDPTSNLFIAHCDKLLVGANTWVPKGAKLGTVGSTGLSTGPHAHIERRKFGHLIDPTRYLKMSQWF